MAYTDSHAHLDDARFDPDRDAVLARARAAGVARLLTIGEATQPAAVAKTLALADTHVDIWAAVGAHPHEARHATEQFLQQGEGWARHPRVLAWGEIGLDYHYDHSPRDAQRAAFAKQLELAKAMQLPVIIHCREAWDDCLDLLRTLWGASGPGGILHCFSGDEAAARQGLEAGFLISFAGNVTFPRAENLRQAARAIPVERLLIETDCPYLAPQSVRGKRNEPAHVTEVAAALGRLHGLSAEEMGARTTENFLRLFPRAAA